MTWTDEKLSAYLDGELCPFESAALERDLEHDPVLAARLKQFERAAAIYSAEISSIDARPFPDAVGRLLAAPEPSNVVRFAPRGWTRAIVEHRAIAASIVCVAAVWGTLSFLSPAERPMLEPGALVAAEYRLGQVLETAATGETGRLGGAAVTPRLSFATSEGGFCRQLDVTSSSGVTQAIACREEGGWRTQIAAYATPQTGDYQTASSDKSPALEAFIDATIAGAPLNAEEEAQAMRSGWASDS